MCFIMGLGQRYRLLRTLALGALVALDRLVEEFSPWNYDDFERWIADLGAWGPIIYVLFFAMSMIVAPIPTGPAPVAAAAAFGGVLGFIYTLTAGLIGASLCFWIARWWGRPILRRFMADKWADEVDRVTGYLGLRVLFVLRVCTFRLRWPSIPCSCEKLLFLFLHDLPLMYVVHAPESVKGQTF